MNEQEGIEKKYKNGGWIVQSNDQEYDRNLFNNSIFVVVLFEIRRSRIEISSKESPRMKIYTKTGDQGTSSLYNGERRMKSDEVFEVLGDLDELESNIGFAIEFSTEKHSKLVEYLRKCQDILFDVNASIATPRDQSNQRVLKKTEFSGCFTTQLENWIDEFDKDLPKTFSFVIVVCDLLE